MKTEKYYLEKIKHNGYALVFVPEKFKTLKMCQIAVNKYGWALNYVPEELKTILN